MRAEYSEKGQNMVNGQLQSTPLPSINAKFPEHVQQQPLDGCSLTGFPGVTVEDLAAPAGVEVEPILSSTFSIRNPTTGEIDQPLLNLPGHGQERLLNVRRILGRSLQEGDRKLVREFLHSN